jgi:tetratricopeptide (TPR) repeat protein
VFYSTIWFMKNFITLIMLILGASAYGQDAIVNTEYIDALKKLKNEATDTLSAEYFYKRAGIKHDFGNYAGSIEDCNKAHKLNPESAKILYNRGVSKLELRKYRDARDDFSAAIKIDPKMVSAYNNRAICKYLLRKYQAAIDDCNKAIEIDPKYAFAYHNRGLAEIKLDLTNKACEDFKTSYKLGDERSLKAIEEYCQ